MGIVIHGMKMPKDENDFVKLVIFNDGRCFVAVGDDEITSKTGVVTATELPPHGRLGDLDALYEVVKHRTRNWAGGWSDIECVITGNDIKNAHTIILAEEET